MSDQDKTTPPGGGYYLCDLARVDQEFSVVDTASGKIVEVETEGEVRALVERDYPDGRFVLTTGRSVSVDGKDLGSYVVIAVVRPSLGRPETVAFIGGAVHGSFCVPFSPEVWHDAVDLVGVGQATRSSPSSPSHAPSSSHAEATSSEHAALRDANTSWSAREDPHSYREKPPGVDWPPGPRGETCADCGADPRNKVHRS